MTTVVPMSMCPHCGWKYPSAWGHINGTGLVPVHEAPQADGGYPFSCPGSQQNPRNPDSDRRPLWKNGGVK